MLVLKFIQEYLYYQQKYGQKSAKPKPGLSYAVRQLK